MQTYRHGSDIRLLAKVALPLDLSPEYSSLEFISQGGELMLRYDFEFSA